MPALHIETSRTRIGVQSAIGTAASTMKELVVYGDQTAIVGKARQNTAPNLNQTRRRREYHASIKLQKSGSPVQLQTYVRALSTALASGTSPVVFSNSSAISHQILYRAIFGAELTPSQGSTVASSSGTPVDTVEVASGHGSRFTVGSIIKITRSGAAPWVRRVTAISTDTLTVYPPLDDSPATSAPIHNLYNYYTGETDS
ncbi:MAG TPA: hypothetical protein VFV33_01260, partial [Gemmatimonadaceae bacterium]|nr:hypothetical protein [Gemmatimonadaceae bacterium]